MAQTGILGGMEQVEKTNLWRFMDVLSIKRSNDLMTSEAYDK